MLFILVNFFVLPPGALWPSLFTSELSWLPIIVAVKTRMIAAHLPQRAAFDLLRLVSASVSQIPLQATCLELDHLHIVMPSPLFLPDSGQFILYIPNP